MRKFLRIAVIFAAVIGAAGVFAFSGMSARAATHVSYKSAERVTAHAAHAAVSTTPSSYIAQYRSQRMRWVSQGKGFAIWAASGGWTKFKVFTLPGQHKEFETSTNGYCVFVYKPLHHQTPFLELTGHHCSGKPWQVFDVSWNGDVAEFESDETFGFIKMNGLSSGSVLVGAPGPDQYTKWKEFPAG